MKPRNRGGGRGCGNARPRPVVKSLRTELIHLKNKKMKLQREQEMLNSVSDMRRKGDGMAGEDPAVEKSRWAEVRIQNVRYMTKEQSRILHQCLISIIKQMPKGKGPRFEDYSYDSGTVTVSCKDKLSQQWLVYHIPQIEPWPGAILTAENIEIPSIPLIVNVVLPASETCDIREAFALFLAQNRGLNTEEWVLMSTEEVSGGILATISIDLCSAAALKELHFRACLGFTTVYFYD